MPSYLTLDYESHQQAREGFEWSVPDDYNAAHDLLRKHDDPKGQVALFQAYPDGRRETYTFHDLDVRSNQVANALASMGVGFGDRVAVALPQKPANPSPTSPAGSSARRRRAGRPRLTVDTRSSPPSL